MDLVDALARRRRIGRLPAALEVKEWPFEADFFRSIQPAPSLLPSATKSITLERTSVEQAIRDGWERCVWMFAGIRVIARAVASVPVVVEVNRGDGWEPPEPRDRGAADLRRLLQRPTPRMTGRQLLERLTILHNLCGQELIHKVLLPSDKLPEAQYPRVGELRLLTPVGWTVIPDRDEEVRAYVYDYMGYRRTFDAHEIIHHQAWNPADPFRGMGAAQVARRAISSDNEAQAWQLASYRNRAIGDGVFVSPQILKADEYDLVRDMIADQHQGADNAREPWVLGGGWKWEDMSRTPVEMDFVQSREQTLIEIAAAISLNPAFLRPDAKYSNLEQARESLWKDNAVPFMDGLTDLLNLELVPHFGSLDRIRVTYDVSDVEALRQDVEKKATAFAALLRAGVPYNHANDLLELGLPMLEPEFGDVPHGTALALMVARERSGNADLESRLVAALRSVNLPAHALLALAPGSGSATDSAREALWWPGGGGLRRFKASEDDRTAAREVSLPLFRLSESIAASIARRFRSVVSEVASLGPGTDEERQARRDRIREALTTEDAARFPDLLGVPRWSDLWLDGPEDEDDEESPTLRTDARAWTVAAGEHGARILGDKAGRSIEIDRLGLERWSDGILDGARDLVVGSTEQGVRNGIVFLRDPNEGGLLSKVIDDGDDTIDALVGLLLVIASLTAPSSSTVFGFLRDQVAAGKGLAASIAKATRLGRGHRRQRSDRIGLDLGVREAWGGQSETWGYAVKSGQVSSGRRIWVDSDDTSVCPICIDLDGQVVPLDEPYYSEVAGRSIDKPGDPHPGTCRCGEAVFEVVV